MKPLRLLLSILVCGCGQPGAVHTTFDVALTASGASSVTDSGWTVTVTRAHASLTAMRFFAAAVTRGPNLLGWVYSTAWAHPGHDQNGAALAEIIVPIEVDLLSGNSPWATANALTGQYHSARLELASGGFTLEGLATRNGQSVPFQFTYSPMAPIDSLGFQHDIDPSSGRVLLTFRLDALLSRCDFQMGTATDGAAFNGFIRGVRDSATYEVQWITSQM